MMKFVLRAMLIGLVLGFGLTYAAQMDPQLTSTLQSLGPNDKLPVEFFMKAQANAASLDATLEQLPRPLRRARVREVLEQFSAGTQRDLLNYLKGLDNTKVDDVRTLWLVNMVSCWATKEVIYTVAARNDVELVLYAKVPVELGEVKLENIVAAVDQIEPNLVTTNARGAWKQGYHGEGVVIGVVDTGVWYTHHDLRDHLWTSTEYPNCGFNFASNQYSSGHPGPSTYDTLTPKDYYGHGTHCAGITSADGAYGNGTRDTMGVAPAAKIMSLPVDVYLHSPYPDTSMENNTMAGMQFCVSPTRDPTNGADVITMSLGLISSWLPRRAVWRAAEVNIMNAGLVHCVAAGNEGSGARTIRTSGDCPPPWPNPANHPSDNATSAVITIGATDNSDQIASFSSRGPSDWGSIAPYNDYAYPPGLIDPDVCMPGVNILSTYNSGDQAYTTMSGTSMATPGAAGVVALMFSKNPNLTPRQVDSILECHAVTDLGPSGKENTFGAGRLNCSLAVAFTPEPTGIRLLRRIIDDVAGGNGDGVINPGETINLPVWLLNMNGYLTQGVTGTVRLDTVDPNVTLIDSFHSFGDMAIGDSAYTGPTGYAFSVAGGLPDGYPIPFTLVCKDAVDSTWYNPLGLSVGTAVLTNGLVIAHDPTPGGNGNGKLDPGDSAMLEIGVKNIGRGNAANVTARLVSLDARLVVVDANGTYGAVAHDTTVFNTADQYAVYADPSIPREFPIPCSLYITADGGYMVGRYFMIPCGILTRVDPIPDGPRAPSLYYAYDNVDSFYVEHPDYNWIELRGRGTRLTLSDDQTITINIPPAFGPLKYYGQSYTQLSICSNGFVMPGSYTFTNYTNDSLPSTTVAAPAIFANWDDLYPPTGGGVWWLHDTANHALVVEWDSVCYYPSSSGLYDKFEIVICDSTNPSASGDNEIIFQYCTADNFTDNTVGIQDPTRTIIIRDLFDGTYHRAAATLDAGSAIKFTTDSLLTGVEEPAVVPGVARLGLYALNNPFRNSSRIRFSLPASMPARVVVYDATGREVRRLVDSGDQPLKAGTYDATWNGNDNHNRTVAGGIYFYRLETPQGTRGCKAVLAR